MFTNVIGQHRIHTFLRNQVQRGRIPHAQLWTGPQSSGLLATAWAYAAYVQCPQHTDDAICGSCAHCRKVKSLIHPDVHFSFPTVGSKATSQQFLDAWRTMLLQSPYFSVYEWLQHIGAGNKQGNITRAECADIMHKLSLKPFEGEYKIWIIWLPEYLGSEGNRLLKLLEEPPTNTIFLLLSHEPDLILPTIVSRCQQVRFPKLQASDIAIRLKKDHGLSDEKAYQIADMSDGNYVDAIRIVENATTPDSDSFVEWLRLCYQLQPLRLSRWIDANHRNMGREDHKLFFTHALENVRRMLLIKQGSEDLVHVSEAQKKILQKLTNVLSTTALMSMISLFNDNLTHIERNAYYKTLMMNSSIRIHQWMNGKQRL